MTGSLDSNCYIVLPSKLVNQSYNRLSELLNTYFPINIKKCIEKREINNENKFRNMTYLESLDLNNIQKNSDNLNVFVLSDVSLKCGFINDYDIILNNKNKHVYLFDEADTILNPLTSELNYPISKQTKPLEETYELFEILYEIYENIFSEEITDNKLGKILNEYKDFYSKNKEKGENNFNIINQNKDFISELINWVRNKISESLNKGKNDVETFYITN
jgi:hypothetical protein